jgi:hypothetical protein
MSRRDNRGEETERFVSYCKLMHIHCTVRVCGSLVVKVLSYKPEGVGFKTK